MDRLIIKRRTVRATLDQVWTCWTTKRGLEGFFAPSCKIEMWPGGLLDVWFFPDNPPGSRGAEGLEVLSFLPQRMLSFEWDAPPHLPEVRSHRNWVVVIFQPLGDREVVVELSHLGWKQGEQWDQAYAYFQDAWEIVMSRFERCMDEGPIDWAALHQDDSSS